MSVSQCRAILGEWKGHVVGSVQRSERLGQSVIQIELISRKHRKLICSGCRGRARRVHDSTARWVRDLPILDSETWLLVPRRRVRCPRCGPKLEYLNWLEPYSRVTRRLGESVARLCSVLPIRHVAAFYRLGWDSVKAIDKSHLRRRLGLPDLDGLETVIMDEFAIQKGHRYATVVVEPRSRRVLWVGRGRSREDVRPFFELLGPERCRKLQAVGMDMTASYELEVKAYCPNAVVVFDLFHVVAKYGREVIDRVRVDEANRLRQDKPARRLVKGSRWLLLRNRDNLNEPDQIRLQELLGANRTLLKVYLLKEDLKHLWSYRHPGYARRFWEGWYRRAIRSRIPPLQRFAKRLKPYLGGILAHARWPLNTSVLEGMNNKIKVIKRMAYGYRDDQYFFLKIRAAFPGIPG